MIVQPADKGQYESIQISARTGLDFSVNLRFRQSLPCRSTIHEKQRVFDGGSGNVTNDAYFGENDQVARSVNEGLSRLSTPLDSLANASGDLK